MNMIEEWISINGFGEKYQVSNCGRVKSLDSVQEIRPNVFINRRGRILKQRLDSHGYYRVNLSGGGMRKTVLVHKLVAAAFVPNPNGYTVIDHIDTNRKNNIWTNLKWVTTKENCNNPLSVKHKSDAMKGKPKTELHRLHLSQSRKRAFEKSA